MLKAVSGLSARLFSTAARNHHVYRVDYNNNFFKLSPKPLTAEQAGAEAKKFQDRGHHQTYYALTPTEAQQMKADYTSQNSFSKGG